MSLKWLIFMLKLLFIKEKKKMKQQKQDLINMLLGFDGPDKIKEDFLFFLQQCPDNFYDRDNSIGHITSSVLVLDETQTKTIIVHHKKSDLWLQPGGHWDQIAESVKDSAMREVFEECFDNKAVEFHWLNQEKILDIDVHDVGHHLHFDIAFLAQVSSVIPLSFSSKESFDVKWVGLKEIVEGSLIYDPRLVRMCEKVLKTKNKPQQKL